MSYTFIIALSLLSSCLSTKEEPGFLGERLAPCTAENSVFADMPFKDWATYYHGTVDVVLEAHLMTLRDIGQQKLACDAPTLAAILTPSQVLRNLASLLPPWQSSERLGALSELHAGSVLLEFLRIYECANVERRNRLFLLVHERQGGTFTEPNDQNAWTQEELYNEQLLQEGRIERELKTARPSLERALDIAGNLDQFRAVSIELECLKRSSLDLRNSIALVADAMSCMAKTPGKSSLRNPPEL